MEEKLLDLIGASDGSEMPFNEWVVAARAAGLRPDLIQKLKRRGSCYTYLKADGQNMIVRGQRPSRD